MRTSAAVPPGARLSRRNSSCRRARPRHGLRRRSCRTASPARPRWRHRAASRSGPKRFASASKKAMRGPVVSSAYLARISSASATPDASPRPDSSSSHRSARLSERAAGVAAAVARAVEQRAAALGNAVEHLAEEGRVHGSRIPRRTRLAILPEMLKDMTTVQDGTPNRRMLWTKSRQRARGSLQFRVNCCPRSGHAGSVGWSARAGACPHPGRAVGRPGAGRSRRRRGQGRAQQDRRRHPRLGPAVHRGQGRRPSRRRLFPLHQPRQALDRGRLRERGRQAHRQEARGALRRADRELQGRRARQVRARLQEPRAGMPAADLLLGDRLRPGRPLCDARRLRPDGAGHGRLHEPHRHRRRRADARAACRCPTSSPASIR